MAPARGRGARAPPALTSSCLRAASCPFAVLCARSASAFHPSSGSFSFARFSKLALMLLVLLLTTEEGEIYSGRHHLPRTRPAPGRPVPREAGTPAEGEAPPSAASPPPGTAFTVVCAAPTAGRRHSPASGMLLRSPHHCILYHQTLTRKKNPPKDALDKTVKSTDCE